LRPTLTSGLPLSGMRFRFLTQTIGPPAAVLSRMRAARQRPDIALPALLACRPSNGQARPCSSSFARRSGRTRSARRRPAPPRPRACRGRAGTARAGGPRASSAATTARASPQRRLPRPLRRGAATAPRAPSAACRAAPARSAAARRRARKRPGAVGGAEVAGDVAQRIAAPASMANGTTTLTGRYGETAAPASASGRACAVDSRNAVVSLTLRRRLHSVEDMPARGERHGRCRAAACPSPCRCVTRPAASVGSHGRR
jgi:hypothetical protein